MYECCIPGFLTCWFYSAPALSSRGATKASLPTSPNDISSRSSWKAFTNGELAQKIEFDDNSSFGVATPFLKSFMQVSIAHISSVHLMMEKH